jgi:hypothetical protein
MCGHPQMSSGARLRNHWATSSGVVKVMGGDGSGARRCSGATAGAGRTVVVIMLSFLSIHVSSLQ